ncbi:MAG: TIGR04282 family arsenosugar biosynthesis glycosyltransferase [Flavobacteriales bacterium]|jgi:rSAM/selenodomain-associated transferase 1|uniref:TIGR04282 family arsenosugar biosynthesis glycosyltransferase n=1 Tax=Candidatus Ulvibacter alkanivorans TaxID=2267620 RepID=UPI000DF22266|nr:TIGR04282 family arsenosugar biosynthesis glycosyltransferase [Candidatus Ulvibacter alkanivorans]MCH2489274.1 TIGR04282 family arsenosugar biosynthesis glycosyltransferase [Flavobacteriales bacterium]
MSSTTKNSKINSRNDKAQKTSKSALIIFTRNPELGKCKTRLAATVGDESALNIYCFLLDHTVAITSPLTVDKFVFYSEALRKEDRWDTSIFRKKTQKGDDLGQRMHNAFVEIFELGYEQAIIIGSDMYDLSSEELALAFTELNTHDFVVGPAKDGGYYLLGMTQPNEALFQNKKWGSDTVLEATMTNLKDQNYKLLAEKNDIDYFEDVKDIAALQQFLPAHLDNNFL